MSPWWPSGVSPRPWSTAPGRTGLVAALTLTAVMVLNQSWARGICKLASILLGMLFGYAVALCVRHGGPLPDVAGAGMVLPAAVPCPSGLPSTLSGCVALGLLFAINSIQAIGDFTATTVGGMDREPTDPGASGGHRGLWCIQYYNGPAGRPAHGNLLPECGHRGHQ